MKVLPYHSYPIIKDDKISLRQIMPTDVKHIVDISFYDGIQATTFEMAVVMQERIDEDIRQGNSIHWGIIDHVTNKIVGTCGQGFMTNAMQLAIDFGLKEIGLTRIWAITSKENLKAIKLLERLKFIKVVDLEDNDMEYELTL